MEQLRLRKYLAIFTLTFIATIVLAISSAYLIEYEPGAGIGVIETFVATLVTTIVFVRDNKRLPTDEERQKLVWQSFFASLFVVLTPIIGFLAYLGFSFGLADLIQGLGEFLPQFAAWIWILIAIFAIGFSYLAVHWGYWLSVTRLAKHFLNDQAINLPSVS